jgi:cobalt-zinc-cadmium efflux system membrane fusion protein
MVRQDQKDKIASAESEFSGTGKAGDTQTVDLSDKQAATLKIGPVAARDFALLKTAVGTIDFNENLLVQVFSQYAGKILKANFNIGDDVKAGDVLFTIVQQQLNAGQVNQLAVLNAQQTYLTAAVVRVQTEANRLSDTAALFMALGGACRPIARCPTGANARWAIRPRRSCRRR